MKYIALNIFSTARSAMKFTTNILTHVQRLDIISQLVSTFLPTLHKGQTLFWNLSGHLRLFIMAPTVVRTMGMWGTGTMASSRG